MSKKSECPRCGVSGYSTVLFRTAQACDNCLADLTERLLEDNQQLTDDLETMRQLYKKSIELSLEPVIKVEDNTTENMINLSETFNEEITKIEERVQQVHSQACDSCKILFKNAGLLE